MNAAGRFLPSAGMPVRHSLVTRARHSWSIPALVALAIALPVMLAVAAVLAVAVARRYRASLAAMDENASKGLAT